MKTMRKLKPHSLVVMAVAVAGVSIGGAQQPGGGQPGTQWSDAQLRDAVSLARVGRKLTPKSWPNGARVAVCLSFDADSEAPLLRDGNTSPTALSAANFGAETGINLDLSCAYSILFNTDVGADGPRSVIRRLPSPPRRSLHPPAQPTGA